MSRIKVFEKPKNGEKILSFDDHRYLYGFVCWVIALLVIENTFFPNLNPGVLLHIGIFAFIITTYWGLAYLFLSYFDKRLILSIYFFDDYLEIGKEKIFYQIVDNFRLEDDGYVTISFVDKSRIDFIPMHHEIYNINSVSEKMKVSNRYKRVSLELVDFLNSKIKTSR